MIDLKGEVRLGSDANAPSDDVATEKSLNKHSTKLSRIFTVPGSYVAANPALTYGFLSFPGTPTLGKLWEVLEVAVYGADAFTSVTGTVLAYVAQQVPQDTSVLPAGYSQVVGIPASIPNVLEKGRRTALLRYNDRLILCLKGLTNGQQLLASMSCIEHDMATFVNALSD